MARLLSIAFVVALLAATAGAFALTEKQKLQRSPVFDTFIALKVFSPVCDCDKAAATIRFRLRKRNRLTVWMERDGRRVATLVGGRSFGAGLVTVAFDGLDSSGIALPDGTYRPVVHVGHKTIRLPNEIVIDTKPPKVTVRHRIYTHISPDGDGSNESFTVRYKVNERAHGLLYADGHQVVRTLRQPLEGQMTWYGKINGRLARPGPHVLRISAEDTAGNRATPFPFAVVSIRYIALGRDRVVAQPGRRFAILVLTDARQATWRFARGTGTFRVGKGGHVTLRLKAPKKHGVYRLFVTASGHAAKALVVVA